MTIIRAKSRHDLSALIQVRECLERGFNCVVEFEVHEVGKPASVQFTPADLEAVCYKLIVSV